MPVKSRREKRPSLTEDQLEYLRTGDFAISPDVFLWRLETEVVRDAFEAIRGDYPAGAFPWAEKIIGGGR